MNAPAEVARHYAEELDRCFASDVAARVIVTDDGATLTLGESCAALPAMERGKSSSSFAVEYARLLLDPSMNGAKFTVTTVNNPADGSERVDVTLRYFRSNGAPYYFTAALELPR